MGAGPLKLYQVKLFAILSFLCKEGAVCGGRGGGVWILSSVILTFFVLLSFFFSFLFAMAAAGFHGDPFEFQSCRGDDL